MFYSSEFLYQLTADRQQDLLAAAAAHRTAQPSPVRSRIARSLRRAADRLDMAAAATGSVRGAYPGRG